MVHERDNIQLGNQSKESEGNARITRGRNERCWILFHRNPIIDESECGMEVQQANNHKEREEKRTKFTGL